MMTEFGEFHLTDEHMAIFRDAVREFIPEYGMTDWNFDFEWLDDPDNQALAEVETLSADRVALFRLNKVWTEKPTGYHLKRIAYHEVLELLLSPLRWVANASWLPADAKPILLNTEAHAIIRRLENAKYGAW